MRFEDTIENVCLLEPAYDNNQPAIVFISNHEEFCKTITTIASLVAHSNRENGIDIVILHSDLDYYDEQMVEHFANQQPDNIMIRMKRIRHEYNKGYIHIDKQYPHEFVTMTFLPYVMKRYQRILCVKSGTIFLEDIDWEDKLKNADVPFKLFYVGKDVLTIYYKIELFRRKYSAREIKDAMTKEAVENIKIYFDKLEPNAEQRTAFLTNEMVHRTQDEGIFYQYAFKTPLFEKMIYEGKADGKKENMIEEKKFSGVYLFPFEKVKKDSRIVIYGNGNVGRQYRDQIRKTGYCKIVAICDKNVQNGVIPIQELSKMVFDNIVVAVASDKVGLEIIQALERYIQSNKIIWVANREIYIK